MSYQTVDGLESTDNDCRYFQSNLVEFTFLTRRLHPRLRRLEEHILYLYLTLFVKF